MNGGSFSGLSWNQGARGDEIHKTGPKIRNCSVKKIMGIFHGIPIENGDRNSGFTHW
jgi:hypothetical protein